MAVLKDLTGQVFGKWTVLYRVRIDSNHTAWRCRCTCGTERDVLSTHLIQGNTKSCFGPECRPIGSDNKQWRGIGEISGNWWGNHVLKCTRGSKKRNPVEVSIDIKYAWELFLIQERKCALTGVVLTIEHGGANRTKYGTASLDRIDSSIGYHPGNVQWVHKDINMLKNTFDQNYFIAMCRQVSAHNADLDIGNMAVISHDGSIKSLRNRSKVQKITN